MVHVIPLVSYVIESYHSEVFVSCEPTHACCLNRVGTVGKHGLLLSLLSIEGSRFLIVLGISAACINERVGKRY